MLNVIRKKSQLLFASYPLLRRVIHTLAQRCWKPIHEQDYLYKNIYNKITMITIIYIFSCYSMNFLIFFIHKWRWSVQISFKISSNQCKNHCHYCCEWEEDGRRGGGIVMVSIWDQGFEVAIVICGLQVLEFVIANCGGSCGDIVRRFEFKRVIVAELALAAAIRRLRIQSHTWLNITTF